MNLVTRYNSIVCQIKSHGYTAFIKQIENESRDFCRRPEFNYFYAIGAFAKRIEDFFNWKNISLYFA